MRKNNLLPKINMIAQIIPALRLKRKLHYFDYLVPAEFKKQIKKGQLVEIPFRNQKVKGVILNLLEKKKQEDYELKPILKIVNPQPLLAAWQLDLTKYLSDYYFVSMSLILKTIIPEIPLRQTAKQLNRVIDYHTFPKSNFNADLILKNRKPVLLRYYNEASKISAYLAMIRKMIKENKQTIIICPQNNNLYKLLAYLKEFKDNTSLFLNTLSKNQFWQEWQKVQNNQ